MTTFVTTNKGNPYISSNNTIMKSDATDRAAGDNKTFDIITAHNALQHNCDDKIALNQ